MPAAEASPTNRTSHVCQARIRKDRRPMKRVYLLRHAKSSWKDGSLADRGARWRDAGRRAAEAVPVTWRRRPSGRSRSARPPAEPVKRSSASRARSAMSRGEARRGALRRQRPKLLACLKVLPREVGSAMLIGHNPGLREPCCHWLPREPGSRACARSTRQGPSRQSTCRPSDGARSNEAARAGRLHPARTCVATISIAAPSPRVIHAVRPPVVSRLSSEFATRMPLHARTLH